MNFLFCRLPKSSIKQPEGSPLVYKDVKQPLGLLTYLSRPMGSYILHFALRQKGKFNYDIYHSSALSTTSLQGSGGQEEI